MDDTQECPVCFTFVTDPIVLGCEHTFCRLCILKSTHLAPDGRSCPLCRAAININVKEQAADADITVAVRAAVGEAVYDARLKANAHELAELHRIADTCLPIFAMYPGCRVGEDVGLHLFEPRYKILIRRAWEGNRCFVYCPYRPAAGASAVIVRVDQAIFLPDGRANIRGRGIEAIELGETWVEDGTAGLFYTRVTLAASAIGSRATDGARPSLRSSSSPAAATASRRCIVM